MDMGAKWTRVGLMMINFTCELDWAKRYPDN